MMNTAKGRKRGAALALVVIFGLVLSILAAAVFTLFQSNVRSHTYVRDRIQARYSAEAGVNLAVHMLMGGADIPQGIMPIQFLPEPPAGGFYDLPGDDLGKVLVYVDPNDRNDQVATANAYAIRALAKIGSGDSTYTYGMETLVLPENFSRFATFLNEPDLSGSYSDGYRFDGPFFANGPVCLYSPSSSSVNDVWFYRFSLASDYYVYGPNGSSGSQQTSPQVGNLTVQPIERMLMGAPYFELGVDPIPFGADEVNWQDTRSAAQSGGLYLSAAQIPNNTRMILRGGEYGDTLMVKTGPGAAVQKYFLGGLTNRVIWINNAASDKIYLKGYPNYSSWSDPISPDGLREPLTIGCNGSIYASGSLQYYDRDIMDMDNRTLLGLVIVHGDFVIACDPDLISVGDWPDGMWHIVTNSDVEYDCTVMVLEGEFRAERWNLPKPPADFMFVGGYIVNSEGFTSTGGSSPGGWDTVIYYDSRLMTMHPPFFPQTGRWDTAYWEEQPDLTEYLIGVNQD